MNLLKQLRSGDLCARWTGPGGLFARAADEIERLQLKLAEAHVAAGTIAVGRDQLDAAENRDYAERRGWKECMGPECLAAASECEKCHLLYQKFADPEPAGNADTFWKCSECLHQPCLLTIVCNTRRPTPYRCPVRIVTRAAKWEIQTPPENPPIAEAEPRPCDICTASAECTEAHGIVAPDVCPGVESFAPEEPPVAEAEDAAREVDPTEPDNAPAVPWLKTDGEAEKNPLFNSAVAVGDLVWPKDPTRATHLADALMRFAHKLEDHIRGN